MLTFDNIGQTLTIHTTAPGVLQSVYTNVLFEAILDWKTAMALDLDVYAMHANVYPFIQDQGVPNDPTRYPYAKFDNAGSTLILGMPWIKQDQIEILQTTDLIIRLPNRGNNDVDNVKRTLISAGYEIGKIEVVGTAPE